MVMPSISSFPKGATPVSHPQGSLPGAPMVTQGYLLSDVCSAVYPLDDSQMFFKDIHSAHKLFEYCHELLSA